MKYVAFRNGQMIDDTILHNIIDAAKRGKMTPEGRKLVLVPDTRYGRADPTGLQSMRSVKKKDCRTLEQIFGKRKSKTLRKVGL